MASAHRIAVSDGVSPPSAQRYELGCGANSSPVSSISYSSRSPGVLVPIPWTPPVAPWYEPSRLMILWRPGWPRRLW